MNPQSSLYKELSKEEITLLIQKSLNTKNVEYIFLLKGGMFNTTYRFFYGDDLSESGVLRLGPINQHLLLRFEENLMEAEQYVYSLCRKNNIPCPKVLMWDKSRKLIDRDFMITQNIESIPLTEFTGSQQEKEALYEQIGHYSRQFHKITGKAFGRLSEICNGEEYLSWAEWFESEIYDIISRLQKLNGLTQEESNTIINVIKKYHTLLDEIKTPHLIHSDLWEGNILIQKKYKQAPSLAAIIDADRAVFGDIDFEFASPWITNDSFMKGYGISSETFCMKERILRRKLYLIDYYLVETYVGLAEYNNSQQYLSYKDKVLNLISELQ